MRGFIYKTVIIAFLFIIGFEFTNLDYENNITGSENYSLFLGQVYNFEENFDMPSRSSLDQKSSDLVGKASLKVSESFSISNEFSIDHNFNDINYNDLKTSFILGNARFNLGYLEENNHIGNSSFFKSDIKLDGVVDILDVVVIINIIISRK